MIWTHAKHPDKLGTLVARMRETGFDMASEPRTGALLRALAASKPAGRLVELGTGTGVGTCWLLDGADSSARLVSIDNDPVPQAVARDVLGSDPRLELVYGDAADWLRASQARSADLVFADAWVGKFDLLELSLDLLKPGGIWIGDDLLPQKNWPDGHALRVPALIASITAIKGFVVLPMAWASGIVLAVRQG